ncbi:MAG: tRNA (guanosine(37)-N1)-methyltransferase TrmD [Thiotrichales bacterium]|nr:tRNA (guanosine(37)-N1)-methyltransferase TrmD [Thiotrichales bacterium]MCY4286149.1 tRNA (guanosine(37)-N1)-methyltransferase TrmD [Thiotrichales bacterium]MCY4351305.1 tRNA (guanosine(37)-N1)-methyltransferase TrmD [Thiotrichales bacterium]
MSAVRVAVVTLFPEMVTAVARYGVTGRAVERGLLELDCWNPRDYARDRHRRVDDRPYGGGPGMVMMYEPVRLAIAAARDAVGAGSRTIHLSPQGSRLDQDDIGRLAGGMPLVLLCGRYEGIDERLLDAEVDEELSLGDYVLSGGELAAMVVIDAMTRLIPGVLGHEGSADADSFSNGLLDCPHFTRPETVAQRKVPEVLLSGDHGAIRRWRLKQSLGRTWERRPDLLRGRGRGLEPEERALLEEYMSERAAPAVDPAATGERSE